MIHVVPNHKAEKINSNNKKMNNNKTNFIRYQVGNALGMSGHNVYVPVDSAKPKSGVL